MKYTKEYLEQIVKECNCMWDVVDKIGVSKQEGNYRYIKNYIKKYNIPITHFVNQRKTEKRTLKEYLVKGKFLTLSGNKFKNKLYKEGVKKPICEECGQNELWCGKKMTLELDHKDGDRYNNELENLRIVCPNCHATFDTHGGKNKGQYK